MTEHLVGAIVIFTKRTLPKTNNDVYINITCCFGWRLEWVTMSRLHYTGLLSYRINFHSNENICAFLHCLVPRRLLIERALYRQFTWRTMLWRERAKHIPSSLAHTRRNVVRHVNCLYNARSISKRLRTRQDRTRFDNATEFWTFNVV